MNCFESFKESSAKLINLIESKDSIGNVDQSSIDEIICDIENVIFKIDNLRESHGDQEAIIENQRWRKMLPYLIALNELSQYEE